MCDIYIAQCELCKCEMDIHISDFCTERKNVHPYCNRCSRKLVWTISAKVFRDKIKNIRQVEGTQSKHIGQEVIILCDDVNAYGVYLN